MKYLDFKRISSAKRMQRYKDATDGDTRKAMALDKVLLFIKKTWENNCWGRKALLNSTQTSFAHKHRFHRSCSPLRSLFNLCLRTKYCSHSYQLI